MKYKNCLIDLHLHIDGALSADTALVLAKMQGTPLPTTNPTDLYDYLTVPDGCNDLNEYLNCFSLPCSLMQTKETISEAVYRLQEDLKVQGLIYAELRFAPQLHTNCGLSQEEVVQSAIDGLNRSDFSANLILCCMRGANKLKENKETLRLADIYRNNGIVAVDLAGNESLFPTSDFEDLFILAKRLNLNFTIHAGEADGADSVRKAVELGASRIGHGVRSVEDTDLLVKLSKKKIALELCITSNLQTKAVSEIAHYPLRELLFAGIPITLNTDNPTVSDTSIKKEFEIAKHNFHLTDSDIKQFLLNSAKYSFADENTKIELIEKIKNA